jgi:hypothetical protein
MVSTVGDDGKKLFDYPTYRAFCVECNKERFTMMAREYSIFFSLLLAEYTNKVLDANVRRTNRL